MPVSGMVAFPNITSAQWQATNLSEVLNENFVLLQDDLKGDLEERLLAAPVFRPSLTDEQIKTLKWMLFPEIRIPTREGEVLDPFQMGLTHLDTYYLPEEGEGLARKLQAKLVRGAVGSGKTLILLYRAKFIQELNPNWRVLILTYNKSLKNYLRQVYRQIGGDPEQVEIEHFHKWCSNLLRPHRPFRNPLNKSSQRGLVTRLLKETPAVTFSADFLVDEFDWIKERIHYQNWPDYLNPDKIKRVGRRRGLGGDETAKRAQIYELFCRYQNDLAEHNICDWADVPVQVLRAIEEGSIPREQYHAVLIDEAQDFAPAWFRVAFSMINPATNMAFIVGDGAQKIYRRDFTWRELGMGITAQNSFVLTRSYRSTREIVETALEVVCDSQTLIQDLQTSGDGLVEPDRSYTGFQHGPPPVLLSFQSPEQEYGHIAKEIAALLEQGFSPDNIVILNRHRDRSEQAVRELSRLGIPCKAIVNDLDMTEPVVKTCTLHSAKGLEFDVVFVCGLEDLKPNTPVDTASEEFQEVLDQERKLLYVGMTRARRRLYITYCGIEADWVVQRLQKKIDTMKVK